MKVFHQDRARKKRLAVGVLAASMLASVLGFAPSAHADVFRVDDCDEEEFIEAVEKANLNPGPDFIVLEKCTYEFDEPYFNEGDQPGPIGNTNSALPPITEELTIVGKGAKVVADDDDDEPSSSFRFLRILDGPVTIRDLSVRDFEIFQLPASTDLDEVAGGCVLNQSGDLLTLRGVTLKDCEVFVVDLQTAIAVGGAVASVGPVTMRSSTVSGSSATAVGVVTAGASVAGGVIVVAGVTDIGSSTLKGNSARAGSFDTALSLGGGLVVTDQLIMASSTVSKNTASARSAGFGTGLSAGIGGGIVLADNTPTPASTISNTTVDGNKAKAEGGAAIATAGGILNVNEGGGANYGLVVDTTGKTNITNNKAACEGPCLAIGGGYTNNLLLAGAGTAQFNNTVFKGNVADGDDGVALGGGLALTGDGTGGPGGTAETVLNNAVIVKNKATGDFFEAGGGIFTTNAANVDIDESTIENNKPDDCFAVVGTLFCDL